jgi:glycine betaine/proline transport system permease protein
MWNISDYYTLPLDNWIQDFVANWLVPNFRPFFRTIEWPIQELLAALNWLLHSIPFPIFLIGGTLGAWRAAGKRVALLTLASIICIDILGLWDDAMTTLAMVFTAVTFCALVGIPLGVLAARSNGIAAVLRPVLDVMQTIPSFVYLVPIVMLFGIGLVPGIIATIIFSFPPIVRLTNLGIRQVSAELTEAAEAFGSTRLKMLIDIQIPLALPTIMAGLNQTLMMALSMVVMAALIGAGGLGLTVYTSIGRLQVGSAALGGIGIVLIAIVLDRITQSIGSTSFATRRRMSPNARENTPIVGAKK